MGVRLKNSDADVIDIQELEYHDSKALEVQSNGTENRLNADSCGEGIISSKNARTKKTSSGDESSAKDGGSFFAGKVNHVVLKPSQKTSAGSVSENTATSNVYSYYVRIPPAAYEADKQNPDKKKSLAQIHTFLHMKNLDTKQTYEECLFVLEQMYATLDPLLLFEKGFKKFFDDRSTNKKFASWVTLKHAGNYRNSNSYVKNERILEVDLLKLETHDSGLYELFLKYPSEWILFFKLKMYEVLKRRVRLIFEPNVSNREFVKNIGYGTFDTLYTFKGTLKRLNNIETTETIAYTYKCMYCPEETFVTKLWYEPDKTVACAGCGRGKTTNHYLYEKSNTRLLEIWLPGVIQLANDTQGSLAEESRQFDVRLHNTDIVSGLKPGDRVELTGVLKRCNLSGQKDEYKYIDVLAVKKINDPYEVQNHLLTVQRVKELKTFSRNKNLWAFMVTTIFPDVWGLDDCKKAALLQQFSLPEESKNVLNTLEYDFLERDALHVLIVGDAGCGKSRVLNRAHQLFGGLKTCGFSSTNAGLTAGMYKDAKGQWGVDVGLLILANKKTVFLDELDKISKNDTINALLECMEQQQVSLAKMNTHGSYEAKTRVFAAANPRFKSNFDPSESLVGQIDLPQVLLSRFDLIIPVLQDISYKQNVKRKSTIPIDDIKLIKDYINYSRTVKKISISGVIWDKISKLVSVVSDRLKKVRNLKPEFKTLNPRVFPSLVRMLCAKSRSRLSSVANFEDYRFVRSLFLNCMVALYNIERPLYDDTTDEIIDLTVSATEIVESKTSDNSQISVGNKLEQAIKMVKGVFTEDVDMLTLNEICGRIFEKNKNLPYEQVRKAVLVLQNNGRLFQPDGLRYKLNRY